MGVTKLMDGTGGTGRLDPVGRVESKSRVESVVLLDILVNVGILLVAYDTQIGTTHES